VGLEAGNVCSQTAGSFYPCRSCCLFTRRFTNSDGWRRLEGTVCRTRWGNWNCILCRSANCQPSRLTVQVKVWTVSSGICVVTFTDHTAAVTGLQWLPSGSAVLSCSLDGTVRAFDLVRYRNFRTFTTPTAVQFSSMAVDPSGEVCLVQMSCVSFVVCHPNPVLASSSPHHCNLQSGI